MSDGNFLKKRAKLKKTRDGFYQYSPLPTKKELGEYYAERYFQAAHGSYTLSYTKEEIQFFRLQADLIQKEFERLLGAKKKNTFLDIGCGEGWVLDRFKKKGTVVTGIDFSSYAIEKFHPHLLPDLIKGDMYAVLDDFASKKTFDTLLLGNVIEHVVDPAALLQKIKKIMTRESVLAIVAPNDFSPLHEHLLKKKLIGRKFWLGYPEHLSYFNKESMSTLLSRIGFNVVSVVASNPIDINLLNDNSNYIQDPSKGKKTYFFQVRTDNFLASIDVDKLLQMYRILGSMGVGRALTYYCNLR